MELKASTQEPARSPSISESNPNEKEISDDDDDDRNHKHRRRDDARSQSQERDTVVQIFTKPNKRGNNNNNNENGHIYKETSSRSNEPWKNYNVRRSDLTQRIRADVGPIRARGRESGVWNQRFNSFDIANQIVNQGPVPPGLFGNRGLPTNAYGGSWDAFGRGVPGMPNGGLDTLHPLGLQMNMGLGLARQRCRDFEEQGFCLRGDMCPMEHGVNRIVVEDVQSLSQFNLPVSLQNSNKPGPPGGPGSLPTNSMFNSKSSHNKTNKRAESNNGQGSKSNDIGADFYDPDQPLWGNDPQTLLTQPNVKENGPLLGPGPLTDEHVVVKSTKNETVEKHEPLNAGKKSSQKMQKAECTLFVNRVPLPQNKRETLISHFHKFGEVVDIRIPINSERAFVQFSKKEEAEAALMAPDAVMGNRFIKLWWADRDNIPVSSSSTLHNDIITPTPVIINTPKVPPPSQSKLENLEVLKEELRKKQEMLDQKRNDFRRKLDKLAKQTTGLKGEVEPEQVAKRPKLTLSASTNSVNKSMDPKTVSSSPRVEVRHNGNNSTDAAVTQSSKSTAVIAPQEPPILRPSLRPLMPIGSPAVTNRFKLDNRPTAFKIISTLPNDLANVAVLKEHFSPFGDLSKVELDDLEKIGGNYSARVYFTTRQSAEKAFLNGKCCKGHNLQFSWVKSSNHNSDGPVVENEIPKSNNGDYEKIESKEINKNKKKTEPDESKTLF